MPSTIELSISGMTCGNCVKHVDHALRDVPGVTDVVVDLAGKAARVETNGTTAPEELIAAVVEEGCEAAVR